MTDRPLTMIRSFIIDIYDRNLSIRASFYLPVEIIAPFGNRIFLEVIPEKMKTVHEPSYYIISHVYNDSSVILSTLPKGPTSLCGRRYFPEKEPPPRITLYPKAIFTKFSFFIKDFHQTLFHGAYTVDDIFLAGAEYLVRKWIEKGNMKMEEEPFYYAVDISPNEVRTIPEDLFPPEAFQVEGVFRLPQLDKDRKRIKFRKITPQPFPVRDPSNYNDTTISGKGNQGKGRIFIQNHVYHKLVNEIELSQNIEEGGFLVGCPFRQPGSPENEDDPEYRWLLEITDLVPAEGSWGKSLMLLFTGETWSRVKKRIDIEFPDKELVSWFHTHLFKATDDFGLSGWDQDLHKRFLTRPWQIAILVNIDYEGNRQVRCFQKGTDGDLVECEYVIVGGRGQCC